VASVRIRPGSALDLGRVYVDHFGLEELYVADLDAIVDGRLQDRALKELTSLGVPLWVDAGSRSADETRRVHDLGATRVVVGLETLPSFDALAAMTGVSSLESERVKGSDSHVAFSLDLRHGVPVIMNGSAVDATETPATLAARAAEAGVGAVVVLDLGRVGMGTGVDTRLLGGVRAAVPTVTLVAGGGVRGWSDLAAVASAGCDAALVATALHTGDLVAADVARAHELRR
jgi:phosphoribosylformimino-5-aminoimidazole carboxamide ribotide isomerase